MAKRTKLTIQNTEVRIKKNENSGENYICITDIAKGFEIGVSAIESWMRNRNTVEFLGTWESVHNRTFNSNGFDGIKSNVGLNNFKISAKKWIQETNAIGIEAKAGRFGGTYAHKDIAMQFCYWLSPSYQIYFIKEFQRLKEDEAKRLGNPWSVRRELAKANYAILTESIKENLIPNQLASTSKEGIYFASEADLLNQIVFGMTSKQFKNTNPKVKGNLRDAASTLDLLVLANLEALNSRLIKWDCDQNQRFELLTEAAHDFRKVLTKNSAAKGLDTTRNKLLSS